MYDYIVQYYDESLKKYIYHNSYFSYYFACCCCDNFRQQGIKCRILEVLEYYE